MTDAMKQAMRIELEGAVVRAKIVGYSRYEIEKIIRELLDSYETNSQRENPRPLT